MGAVGPWAERPVWRLKVNFKVNLKLFDPGFLVQVFRSSL